MKRLLAVFILGGLFTACNNKGDSGPYEEILSRPLFAAITDSIKKEPERDELYFRRAVLLNLNNFPEPALADFQKAWSLKKEEKYALGVATILLDKKPDSALVFLESALQSVQGSLILELTLARAYDTKGHPDKALAILDKILSYVPNEIDVLRLKADILGRKGQARESIAILEKLYSFLPHDVELNYELAMKYAEAKDPKVLKLCDSLLRADTDSTNKHAEPAYFKGIYYSNIRDHSNALQQFDIAIQRNFYYLNAYIEKGRILLEQKKTEQALATFKLAQTLSPEFPDAYYWIAKCEEAQGKIADAKLNYQRAYNLDRTFLDAKEALDSLNSLR